MKLHHVLTVYLKELRDALRDRRTLISTIVIPTFVMPAMTFGIGRVATKVIATARGEVPAVMVLGTENAPQLVEELRATGKFRLVPAGDYQAAITEKRVRAAVKIPENFERDLATSSAAPIVIFHYEGELKSGFAAGEIEQFFRQFRDRKVADALAARALPARLVHPFELSRENVAPPEKVGGNLFGGIVPYLIIILCFTGAMYPAIDVTAGEKERGTMETLLCSPVARGEIVLGKFFLVLTGSLSAMTLALLSMGITGMATGLIFAGTRSGALHGGAGGGLPLIDPWGILGVLAMVLPVAVLFSAVQLAVALFARSTKEAQSYLGPMMFLVIGPAIIGLLPGIELNAPLALVPLLNLSLICKEMLSGVWHWNYLALIFGSSCLYAALALGWAVKMFGREEVLFRA